VRSSISIFFVAVVAGAFLTACGGTDAPGASAGPAASSGAAGGQGAKRPADGCPITVDMLGKATSLDWKLQEKRDDHQLETLESVKATVCLWTAADAPQAGGDPLVLRADIVTGGDAATVRKEFSDNCTEYGGKLGDSSGEGGTVCDRDGAVVEGLVGSDDRLVNVYLVNADKPTATKLSPAFGEILGAVVVP
jgi:hypothetical protein